MPFAVFLNQHTKYSRFRRKQIVELLHVLHDFLKSVLILKYSEVTYTILKYLDVPYVILTSRE